MPIGFGYVGMQGAETVLVYALRSRGDVDVAAVAKKLGGGGHTKAAGFSVRFTPLVHAESDPFTTLRKCLDGILPERQQ